MFTTNAKLIAIGFVLLSLILSGSSEATSEVNNQKLPTKYSQSANSERNTPVYLTEVLFSRLDILLGFVLGLSGTIFIDYLRKRQRTKALRDGVRNELKQVLASMNFLALNDSCNIDTNKVRSWLVVCNG